MTRRNGASSHYEGAFEYALRRSEVLYLAIDEHRKPIYQGNKIKNFDFVVNSFKGKYLIDIKGKLFGATKARQWDNWITVDDLTGLREWSSHFTGFTALIVIPYAINITTDSEKFRDIVQYKGRHYGIVGIALSDYYINAKGRSTGASIHAN